MSELGDLLELLYRADSSWQTVHARIRHWTHHERSFRALERHNEQHGGQGSVQMVVGGARGERPAESAYSVEIWLDRAGRSRRIQKQGDHVWTTVSDGEQRWTYSPEMGAIVHDASHEEDMEPALSPRSLLGAADLEPAGEGEAAGRPALLVRGAPRHLHPIFPTLVPAGADELRLLVDRERGVVLRSEARMDGEPFQLTEVEEIEFDTEFPPDTFVFEPPRGEEIRSAEDAYRVERVTVEEAARLASFTIVAPRGLAGEWHANVLYQPARRRPPLTEHVHLAFFDSSTHHFSVAESEEPLEYGSEPTSVVDHGGREVRISERDALVELNLEVAGTHVRLTSDNLPLESLLELAGALAPVSPDPPKIVE